MKKDYVKENKLWGAPNAGKGRTNRNRLCPYLLTLFEFGVIFGTVLISSLSH